MKGRKGARVGSEEIEEGTLEKEGKKGRRQEERKGERRKGRKQQRCCVGFNTFSLDGGKQGKGEDEHPKVR